MQTHQSSAAAPTIPRNCFSPSPARLAPGLFLLLRLVARCWKLHPRGAVHPAPDTSVTARWGFPVSCTPKWHKQTAPAGGIEEVYCLSRIQHSTDGIWSQSWARMPQAPLRWGTPNAPSLWCQEWDALHPVDGASSGERQGAVEARALEPGVLETERSGSWESWGAAALDW